MADVKISQLTALASANVVTSSDVLPIVDASVPQTKKITVENLLSPITIDKSAGTITSLGTVTGNATFGANVNITGDLSIGAHANGNTTGHAVLNLAADANEGADSYLNFDAGTTTKGHIAYDHHATAGSQSMKFVVGDDAVTAMTIEGDGTVVTSGALQPSGNVTIGGFAKTSNYFETAGGSGGQQAFSSSVTSSYRGGGLIRFFTDNNVSIFKFGDEGAPYGGYFGTFGGYTPSGAELMVLGIDGVNLGTNRGSEIIGLRVANDGTVGFGTTSPRNTIHSTGIVEISNADSNADTERIRFGRTSDNQRYSSIFHKLSDSAANNHILFKLHDGSSQTEVLRIQGDNKIGFGGLSPVQKYDFKGDSHNDIMRMYDSANSDNIWILRNEVHSGTSSGRLQLLKGDGDGVELNGHDGRSSFILGNTAIGTTTPVASKLHVEQNSSTSAIIRGIQAGTGDGIYMKIDQANASAILVQNTSGVNQWYIQGDGDYDLGSDLSDKRMKLNIESLSSDINYLDKINLLNPVKYNKKKIVDDTFEESSNKYHGFIAQDIMDIIPEAVHGSEDTNYSLDYKAITAFLVKAVQELSAKVETLENA